MAHAALRSQPRQQITVDSSQNIKSDDKYVLARGYAAASRLNLQHYLWKETQRYLLHPWVREQLRTSAETGRLKVADLATGTGIWLLDLSRSSELQDLALALHGFDISSMQFPHAAWLPENLSFDVRDILTDPPNELWGTFDLVHIRLVVLVARQLDDPRRIIRHVHKLLKPGGILQWEEVEPLGHHRILVREGAGIDTSTTEMDEIFGVVTKAFDFTWVTQIPSLLEKEGFTDAVQRFCDPPPVLYQALTWSQLNVLDEFSHSDVMAGDRGVQFRKKIEAAYLEASAGSAVGACTKVSPAVTVARKAL
ncbi:S-adenosyl-L-methionine-dependent methyltransferase [Microdochium trichocladiopsis]|uniref:S-adenosyl-L-methionine-dependent methyltransferase n=1 Tax=Microdochium trichocladiopsis TaxID=1682393 RepID=A0A9P9BIH0_9PEZI|nr:S-adenosyl-L-methionine-dependent methyltransferase [Microdochium trichocladiopsis]KAH7012152.1 S-adenosyl-L-methionine-dependent methyltransferase [Microdochium trichocladiopsis]